MPFSRKRKTDSVPSAPQKARKTAAAATAEGAPGSDAEEGQTQTRATQEKSKKKPGKGRGSKAKPEEQMPLAARTKGLRMLVGAHVSCAGGVHNGVGHALHIGANCFAMFLKSQRTWKNPPLQDEHRDRFRELAREHDYLRGMEGEGGGGGQVLPHGSYLVNLAQKEADKAEQAYASFVDDLGRCDALGIRLYNFHPGNTGPHPRSEAISRIAAALNRAHAHAGTGRVVTVLENMAGGGNAIGSTFEDLRDIIDGVDDKSRVGVCLDTCHAFAAGYDLRDPEAFRQTLADFDSVVGIKYLRALHLNDSKAPLGSHRDLHQNIGLGFLGLRAFHNIMNEKRFEGLPMVLETPIDHKDKDGKSVEDKGVWAREIKLLESLIGMDASSKEFAELELDLAAKGVAERKKLQDQADKKTEKDRKKASKA